MTSFVHSSHDGGGRAAVGRGIPSRIRHSRQPLIHIKFKLLISRSARHETIAISWYRIVKLIRFAPISRVIRYCWATPARDVAKLRLHEEWLVCLTPPPYRCMYLAYVLTRREDICPASTFLYRNILYVAVSIPHIILDSRRRQYKEHGDIRLNRYWLYRVKSLSFSCYIGAC